MHRRKNCSPVPFRSRILSLSRHPTTGWPHFLRRFPHLNRLTDRCRTEYARPFHCHAPDRSVPETVLWVAENRGHAKRTRKGGVGAAE